MTAVDPAVQGAIKAAMAVARDVAEGRVDPAELDALAVAECRRVAFVVAGPARVTGARRGRSSSSTAGRGSRSTVTFPSSR